MRRLALALALVTTFVVFVAAPSPAEAAEDAWGPSVVVGAPGFNVQLVSVDDTLIAAWVVSGGTGGEDVSVLASYSTDDGQTWSSPQSIASHTQSQIPETPTLAAVGATVTALWSAVDSNTSMETVYSTSSTDGGQSWSAVQQLSDSAVYSFLPQLASDGTRAIATWSTTDDIGQVATALGGGPVWTAPSTLTDPTSYSNIPMLAADAARIGVAWGGLVSGTWRVYFRASTDGGAMWSAPVAISAPQSGVIFAPQVVIDGDAITVAWIADDDQLWATSSADGGAGWSTPAAVSDGGATVFLFHLMGYDDEVAVVWQEGVTTTGVLRFSTFNSTAWSDPVGLSDPAMRAAAPQLISHGDYLVAAWTERSGLLPTAAVRARISTDAGLTWQSAQDVGFSTHYLIAPPLASSHDTVTVLGSALPDSVVTSSSFTFAASDSDGDSQLATTGPSDAMPTGLATVAAALLVLGAGVLAAGATRRRAGQRE
ncbi:MAG TPA: exo-alpha-sialidase [Terrimesophilobacter sp.]|nr:exo-alpha-sialidase [Terrimesophilobacter sp.]HRP99594.1 exo-alpha-sialidase [Terrimesophilobacter sp.]